MKKAVIYGRVSTQDKQDYGRQLFDLKKFAKNNEYQIVEEFTEKISGAKKERPEFSKMLKYVDEHGIKAILVTELSRFGRIGVHTRLAIEELAEKGVDVYFHDKGFHTVERNGKVNGNTMMIVGLLADVAKNELDTLKDRIKSGLRYSAVNGGAISGKYQAYGFRSDNKKLVVDEDEKKLIIEIFNLYRDGLGCTQIARHLNSKGVETRFNKVQGNIKTKGGTIKKGSDFRWSSGTITTILKNPIYKGERIHKDEVIKIDAFISPVLFDTVQKIMKGRNNRSIRTIKNDNHLKGILKCGVCGQAYYMHKRKNKRDSAYVCLSHKLRYEGKEQDCNSPSISIEKLLNSIIISSHFILSKSNNFKAFEDERKATVNVKQIEYDNLKAEVKKISGRNSRLLDLLEDGDVDKAEYRKRKAKNDQELTTAELHLEELTTQLAKLKKKTNFNFSGFDFLPVLRDTISMVTVEPAKATKKLLETYTVKKDTLMKISITFNFYNNMTISYIVSRFSSIMTRPDGSTEDLKDNFLLMLPNVYVN